MKEKNLGETIFELLECFLPNHGAYFDWDEAGELTEQIGSFYAKHIILDDDQNIYKAKFPETKFDIGTREMTLYLVRLRSHIAAFILSSQSKVEDLDLYIDNELVFKSKIYNTLRDQEPETAIFKKSKDEMIKPGEWQQEINEVFDIVNNK